MKALCRVLFAAALVLGIGSCRTATQTSNTKDLVQGESANGLAAQIFVYYADATNVYRASCPVAQSTIGNYRQFCRAAQSVNIPEFIQKIRTSYLYTYRQQMSAQHESALATMIQYMANPQATWDSGQFGPTGIQLAGLFSLGFSSGSDGGSGGGNSDGGGTPIPGPSDGRIAGPVQVNIPFGQTVSLVNVNGVGARKLPVVKFVLSRNCPFMVKGVVASNNSLQGSSYNYSVTKDQWNIQQNIDIDNMVITLEGFPGACNLTLNMGTGGQDGGTDSDTIPDGDSYYMTLVGYQRQSALGSTLDPKSAHTFATYARVQKKGQQIEVIREDTISWLPRANNGEVVLNTPVPGMNWSLSDSVKKGSQRGLQMLRWGPFPISKALYDRVIKRKSFIDQWADYGAKKAAANSRYYSGNVIFGNVRLNEDGIYYIAIDPLLRDGTIKDPPRGANNCFHAIGDVLASGSIGDWLVNGTARGWKATDQTLEYYLLQAGREFVDYPQSSLLQFVRKYQPIAQAWGLGGVSHTESLPVMPAVRNALGNPAAALPPNWGKSSGVVN